MNIEPYQQRVVTELAELNTKIEKLDKFIASPPFFDLAIYEQRQLYVQIHVMEQYAKILADRIGFWARHPK